MRLPVVTSFLLLGIFAGPEGLNVVSSSIIGSLRIIEPVALGLITFAAGEQLYFGDLRLFARRHYLAVGLETMLPVLLVGASAWLVTGRLEVALPVGAIAGTTGLATVMSTLKESGAQGGYAKLLGFATASDNFFAILVFSFILPLVVGMETGQAIGTLYIERLVAMVASIGIGFVAGFAVSRLIKNVRSSHELSMLVLAHVLLVVGVTEYLGFSVLLAGLTMGTTAVNLTREVRDRDRAFTALGTLEFPIVAMFFLWAGSSLQIRALGSIGLLFFAYLLARVVGKLTGPFLTALSLKRDKSKSRRFVGLGMSLLPQAGAAVGLGIVARDALPSSGETVLAVILASVVVFELIGPLGVHWAARFVGEARTAPEEQPLTLHEAISELRDRRARVVVLVDSEADQSIMRIPLQLVSRLDADLFAVPVAIRPGTDFPLRSPRTTSVNLVTEEDEGGSRVAIWCPELTLQTTPALGYASHQFVSALSDYSPDIVLVSREGSVGKLLDISETLSRQLNRPVLEIPAARASVGDRSMPTGRVLLAVSKLSALWRKSRSGLAGLKP